MQIEDYLYQKKLHELLSGKKSKKMEQADWDLFDRRTLGVVPDVGKKRGFQYHQREDNCGFDEGAIKYVRETIRLEQGIFDASFI